VRDLHKYDCLRANKATMAWGLEARVPFLDREFLEYVMNLDPAVKMAGNRVEKWILRKAFDVPEDPYLPEEVMIFLFFLCSSVFNLVFWKNSI
jgi:asparagine synthase (glutamine-hydrolysing)